METPQRFEFIRSTFYKGAVGIILLFDLTREHTYYEIRKWFKKIRQIIGKNVPFLLIGINVDLFADIGEVIYRNEARAFAEKEGGFYIETSLKQGEYVEEALMELSRRIIDFRS